MVLWVIAAFAAFFVKGLCGFANTLVFTSILGFGVANVNISPVELLLGYPTNLILIWDNRKQLKSSVYLPLIVLVLGGSIPGAFLLKNIDIQVLKIVFGAVVVLIGVEMFFREKSSSKMKESKLLLGVIGILSGLLCGLFGIGALLAAYVGRVTNTADEFKANISAVFIAENTFRIILYSLIGVITPDALKHALLLVPVMLAGLFAGMKSARILDEKLVRKLVILLLIVSGIVLIINNI
ncbi:MAG: sulfite exporter TauE/SafE family protein [Solobacterium sp.]|nr:sulfite exporter TauE/SafE family protein [Solobacterium sp.]